jgi:UDP-N-acetyl-D-galactosamine dehydrogenase
VTEEKCVPLLAEHSGMRYLSDFKVGYSPERINPGDPDHRLQTVSKIVSGCDDATLDLVSAVYGSIIDAGVYRAASIKVAEAAKVIENTQRDINIALMNELSIIFHRLEIDTLEVLRAAGTKWNFLKFYPGLVGGHCIGVDPYYLTHKAQSAGYHPEVILAGRCINDSMGKFVAENTIKELIKAGHTIMGRSRKDRFSHERSLVLILGLTFKENVADIRNTRVVDIINELDEYNIESLIYDPLVSAEAVRNEYGLEILPSLSHAPPVDAVILAVPHEQFKELSLEKIANLCRKDANPVLMDLRGVFEPKMASRLGIRYWRL